jgi:hypothetical protein
MLASIAALPPLVCSASLCSTGRAPRALQHVAALALLHTLPCCTGQQPTPAAPRMMTSTALERNGNVLKDDYQER